MNSHQLMGTLWAHTGTIGCRVLVHNMTQCIVLHLCFTQCKVWIDCKPIVAYYDTTKSTVSYCN